MKKIICIILLVFFASPAFAATNHYINAACASACDGSTWAKGWATFGAVTWTRGDTYYVAGGTYNGDVTISVATPANGWITIKKANAADNSGDEGWNASFASNQAVINGAVSLSYGNIEINGVTGSETSGHGIKIYNSSTANGAIAVQLEDGATYPFHLHYLEILGPGYDVNSDLQNGIRFNQLTGTTKGLLISYCYIHEFSGMGILVGGLVGTSWADYGFWLDHNFISETGGCTDPAKHGQPLQVSYGNSDAYTIVSNNKWRNGIGTGFIVYLAADARHSYIRIYNNVFYMTNTTKYNIISPGIVTTYGNGDGSLTNYFYFYNNTIYGVGNESTAPNAYARMYITSDASITASEAKNNLWINSYLPYGGMWTGINTQSNNGFWNNNGSSDPGDTETESPVTNAAAENFTLKADSEAASGGADLSSVFTTDITGTTITTWHQGAYTVNTGGDETAPTVTAFVIPSTATSLTVDVSTFTCTDAVGVTAYCATTTNSSAGCSWVASAPSTITFTSQGAQTGYGWCKDAAGNTSSSSSDSVTITLGASYPNIIGTGAAGKLGVGAAGRLYTN